jgi:hypothetical protein
VARRPEWLITARRKIPWRTPASADSPVGVAVTFQQQLLIGFFLLSTIPPPRLLPFRPLFSFSLLRVAPLAVRSHFEFIVPLN